MLKIQARLVDIRVDSAYPGDRGKEALAMKLGEKICQLRASRRLSQGDLSDALGVSRQSVSKWETGGSVPDLDKLVAMSELFGVSLDELVKGEAEGAKPTGEPAPPAEPARQGISTRRVTGIVLLAFGGLITLLLWWTILPLFLTPPLLAAGVVCLAVRRHTLLWCLWAAYLPPALLVWSDAYLVVRLTGPGSLIAWTLLGLFLALMAATAVTFLRTRRKKREEQ